MASKVRTLRMCKTIECGYAQRQQCRAGRRYYSIRIDTDDFTDTTETGNTKFSRLPRGCVGGGRCVAVGAGVGVGTGVAVGATDSRGEQNWLSSEQAASMSRLARSNSSNAR